jgi:hypothetical protein
MQDFQCNDALELHMDRELIAKVVVEHIVWSGETERMTHEIRCTVNFARESLMREYHEDYSRALYTAHINGRANPESATRQSNAIGALGKLASSTSPYTIPPQRYSTPELTTDALRKFSDRLSKSLGELTLDK